MDAGAKVIRQNRVDFREMEPFRIPPKEAPFDYGYDAHRAWWLVNCAALAYSDAENGEKVAKGLWGFKEFQMFDIEKTDTQGMGMANDDFIILAFRGTESADDWGTNLDAPPVPFNDLPQFKDIVVHRGFQTAILSILPVVKEFLEKVGKFENPDKPLYICGHSLGGALATLCHAHFTMTDKPISVNGVVTIGQPRVGTKEFKKKMLELSPCSLQRIFNANDIVPTVPPFPYCHYGNRLYFNQEGKLHWKPVHKVTRRDKTGAWIKAPLKSGTANHSRHVYLKLVKDHYNECKKKIGNGAVYKAVIKVNSAEGLRICDPARAKSDPYVVVKFNGIAQKGKVHHGELSPTFDETYALPEVHSFEYMNLELWDHDHVGSHNYLGGIMLPFDDCRSIPPTDYPLQPRPGHGDSKVKGTVNFGVTFYQLKAASTESRAKGTMTLHNGKGLKNGTRKGAFGLYARISIGKHFQKQTEKVKSKDNQNPEFNHTFSVPSLGAKDHMYVDIYEHLLAKGDEFLGRAQITFDEGFMDAEGLELQLGAREANVEDKSRKITGSIFMSFEFDRLPNDGLTEAEGVITIHKARGVKAADSNGLSDPYVVASIGQAPNETKFKTKIVPKTLDPEWEESFTTQTLSTNLPFTFLVYDHDKIGSDDFLGAVEMSFGSYYDIKEQWFKIDEKMGGGKKVGATGDLCISMTWTAKGASSAMPEKVEEAKVEEVKEEEKKEEKHAKAEKSPRKEKKDDKKHEKSPRKEKKAEKSPRKEKKEK